ncbi:phosphoglycolate phosphatase [Spirochaetia bacterium]|nr:phosphoglycolate phosphatase [Spirochaetia bacterium]
MEFLCGGHPSAVIFDFDGTLYNLKHFVRHLIFSYLPGTLRFRADRKVRKEFKGCDLGSADALYEVFFARFAACAGFKTSAAARQWYFSFYMPLMCRVLKKYHPARKNMIGAIQNLNKANIPIAVYSDYPCTLQRMEAIGLPCGISKIPAEHIFGVDNFGALKPAVRPFRLIADTLGIPCEKVLVIGDKDDTDGAGARAAGMKFRLVNSYGTVKNAVPAVCDT